jgi:hypothetical protein
MKRIALALVLTLVLTFGLIGTAGAITNGEPDNDQHPYVGLLVFDFAPGEPGWRCSGALISPTVVLTAGHCTDGAVAARIWMYEDVSYNHVPYPLYPFGGPGMGRRGHCLHQSQISHPEIPTEAMACRLLPPGRDSHTDEPIIWMSMPNANGWPCIPLKNKTAMDCWIRRSMAAQIPGNHTQPPYAGGLGQSPECMRRLNWSRQFVHSVEYQAGSESRQWIGCPAW